MKTPIYIAIANGPNMNLIGQRETDIYGTERLDTYLDRIEDAFPGVVFTRFQSNHEGALIDFLQDVGFTVDGIVLNAAAYTHTSVAIADTLRAITSPVVEVHISDPMQREPYRHVSLLSDECIATIAGQGLDGYRQAIALLVERCGK